MTTVRPVRPLGGHTLTGRFVALEPLEERHHAGLIAAAADPDIWHYMPVTSGADYAAQPPFLATEGPSVSAALEKRLV